MISTRIGGSLLAVIPIAVTAVVPVSAIRVGVAAVIAATVSVAAVVTVASITVIHRRDCAAAKRYDQDTDGQRDLHGRILAK